MSLVLVVLGLLLPWGSIAEPVAQGGAQRVSAMADSAYFSGDAAAALAILDTGPGALESPERRWRAIRSYVALGLTADSRGERNRSFDRGVELAATVSSDGSSTTDELYWGAAVAGLRALNSGPRRAGELAAIARTQARLVLAADSLHGGAHNVLGRVNAEFLSLSWAERLAARVVLGRNFPSDMSWELAEAHLRRASALWPHMVLFHLDLARVMERQGKAAEARRAAERALATPPLHPPDPRFQQEARAILQRLP